MAPTVTSDSVPRRQEPRMRKSHPILSALALTILVAGCGGGGEFAQEKTVIDSATASMDTFSEAVEGTDSPDVLAGIMNTFTEELAVILPQMKEISTVHPEWETDPPEELADSFEKFAAANEAFKTSMPKMMQMAGQNQDNEALTAAMENFQATLMGM